MCWLCVIVYLQSLFSVESFSNSHLKLVNGTVFMRTVAKSLNKFGVNGIILMKKLLAKSK